MINVFINGRLGADAEVKTSPSSKQYVQFNMATDDYDRQTKSTTTTWIRVVAFDDRTVKNLAPHLKKGSSVTINGVLRTSIFTKQDGTNAISHDVIADRVEFGLSSGNSQGDEATVSTTTTESTTTKTTVVADCGTLKRPQAVAVVAETSSSTDVEEELPF